MHHELRRVATHSLSSQGHLRRPAALVEATIGPNHLPALKLTVYCCFRTASSFSCSRAATGVCDTVALTLTLALTVTLTLTVLLTLTLTLTVLLTLSLTRALTISNALSL